MSALPNFSLFSLCFSVLRWIFLDARTPWNTCWFLKRLPLFPWFVCLSLKKKLSACFHLFGQLGYHRCSQGAVFLLSYNLCIWLWNCIFARTDFLSWHSSGCYRHRHTYQHITKSKYFSYPFTFPPLISFHTGLADSVEHYVDRSSATDM